MPHRRLTDFRVEQSGQDMSAGIVRPPLDADVARPKRIDRYIDYFGSGNPRRIGVTPDPCGESLLDAGGAR
jgi:hypothetical protein